MVRQILALYKLLLLLLCVGMSCSHSAFTCRWSEIWMTSLAWCHRICKSYRRCLQNWIWTFRIKFNIPDASACQFGRQREAMCQRHRVLLYCKVLFQRELHFLIMIMMWLKICTFHLDAGWPALQSWNLGLGLSGLGCALLICMHYDHQGSECYLFQGQFLHIVFVDNPPTSSPPL